MLKKTCIFLALIILLCLCACGVVDSTDPLGTQDNTDVVDPTDSPAKQYTPVSVVQASRTMLTDNVPEYDINSTDTIIMGSDANSSYFTASYIHLSVPAASGRTAYDGGIFWVCDDEMEVNQGSHYSSHIVQNGQLQPLQIYSFSQSYDLKGTTVKLELEYSLFEDEVLINYTPDLNELPSGTICDTSRGVHECLAEFKFVSGDGDFLCYYAKVDLETGELTDFLSDFEQDVFGKSTRYRYWCKNDNLIVTMYVEQSPLYCYDITSKTLQEYKPEHEQYDARLNSYKEMSDGLICRYDYYDGEALVETRLWKISFADGSMTPLSDGTQSDRLIYYSENYVLYQDSNKAYYVHNIASNQHFSLPEMKSVFQCKTSTFIYIDLKGDYYVCDVMDGESMVLEFSGDFDRVYQYEENCSGRKLAAWVLDKEGVYQIVVFDADTNTLIELQRSRGTGIRENRIEWSKKTDTIIVRLEGASANQDFVIYDFD